MADRTTVVDAARGVTLEVLVEGDGEPVVLLPSGSGFGGAIQAEPEEWWRAGSAPMLVFQPLEDAMAPRQVGLDVLAALGDRGTYVEVPRCGHAILPEQPDVVVASLVAFLRAHPLVHEGDGPS